MKILRPLNLPEAAVFTSPDLLKFFRGLPLFAGVNEQVLIHLKQVSHLKRVPKNQYLFFQDDEGGAAYLVYKGTVSILLATPDGRELVINEMCAGDLFGDLASLLGQSRTANAMAQENSEVVVIPQSEFLAVLDQEPRIMRHLLEIVAQRLQVSSEHASALAFLNAPARLARILLQLSGQQRKTAGLVVVSQDELAKHLGVTRQTVAKALGQWRRAGWIITGRGRIMLLDKPVLARLANESIL